MQQHSAIILPETRATPRQEEPQEAQDNAFSHATPQPKPTFDTTNLEHPLQADTLHNLQSAAAPSFLKATVAELKRLRHSTYIDRHLSNASEHSTYVLTEDMPKRAGGTKARHAWKKLNLSDVFEGEQRADLVVDHQRTESEPLQQQSYGFLTESTPAAASSAFPHCRSGAAQFLENGEFCFLASPDTTPVNNILERTSSSVQGPERTSKVADAHEHDSSAVANAIKSVATPDSEGISPKTVLSNIMSNDYTSHQRTAHIPPPRQSSISVDPVHYGRQTDRHFDVSPTKPIQTNNARSSCFSAPSVPPGFRSSDHSWEMHQTSNYWGRFNEVPRGPSFYKSSFGAPGNQQGSSLPQPVGPDTSNQTYSLQTTRQLPITLPIRSVGLASQPSMQSKNHDLHRQIAPPFPYDGGTGVQHHGVTNCNPRGSTDPARVIPTYNSPARQFSFSQPKLHVPGVSIPHHATYDEDKLMSTEPYPSLAGGMFGGPNKEPRPSVRSTTELERRIGEAQRQAREGQKQADRRHAAAYEDLCASNFSDNAAAAEGLLEQARTEREAGEFSINLLLPALMQLSEYTRDGADGTGNAFSRFSLRRPWTYDHSPEGSTSFFELQRDALPPRRAQDPRYEHLPQDDQEWANTRQRD